MRGSTCTCAVCGYYRYIFGLFSQILLVVTSNGCPQRDDAASRGRLASRSGDVDGLAGPRLQVERMRVVVLRVVAGAAPDFQAADLAARQPQRDEGA